MREQEPVSGEEDATAPRARADAQRQRIEDALRAVDAHESSRRRFSGSQPVAPVEFVTALD